MSENEEVKAPAAGQAITYGNGSVAHQIIGGFISNLSKQEGYGEIAKRLEKTIFEGKPNEMALRIAILGGEAL